MVLGLGSVSRKWSRNFGKARINRSSGKYNLLISPDDKNWLKKSFNLTFLSIPLVSIHKITIELQGKKYVCFKVIF